MMKGSRRRHGRRGMRSTWRQKASCPLDLQLVGVPLLGQTHEKTYRPSTVTSLIELAKDVY
jgi:hypothetical protein